jgi:hypothetical protein
MFKTGRVERSSGQKGLSGNFVIVQRIQKTKVMGRVGWVGLGCMLFVTQQLTGPPDLMLKFKKLLHYQEKRRDYIIWFCHQQLLQ